MYSHVYSKYETYTVTCPSRSWRITSLTSRIIYSLNSWKAISKNDKKTEKVSKRRVPTKIKRLRGESRKKDVDGLHVRGVHWYARASACSLSYSLSTSEGELSATGAHEVVGGETRGGGHLVRDVDALLERVVRAPFFERPEAVAVVIEKLAMEEKGRSSSSSVGCGGS